MQRRPVLFACLSMILSAPGAAAELVEGAWIGQSGPQDDRATVGLQITRTPNGELAAQFYCDLLGTRTQPFGVVRRIASQAYSIAAADVEFGLSGDQLLVTGLLHDPRATVVLRRVSRLPVAKPGPVFPSGPRARWQTRLGGAIFAAVEVLDGVAYVGSVDGVLSAVAIMDGARRWSFAAGRPIFGEVHATSDKVYFVCDNAYLFCLERASGKESWRYDLGGARVSRVLPNPFVHDYDYRAPRPMLADGVLFVGSADGSFHALAAITGERLWRVETGSKIRMTAVVSGSLVVFGNWIGQVVALERASGRTVWQFDAGSPATAPAVAGGRLLFGTRDSMLYALDLANGHPIWTQYWWGSWVESCATEWGGLAYIGSGDLERVSCIDPATGRTRWRSEVGGWVLNRPAVTQQFVYAGVSGARRAASFWSPQTSALTALDRQTGKVAWRRPMPETPGAFLHGFVAPPVVAGGNLLIGGMDGTLYAFPAG